ncbi:MAG: hypothetical protein ACRDEA_18970, partial [Microcystaceae cyanobacterium]
NTTARDSSNTFDREKIAEILGKPTGSTLVDTEALIPKGACAIKNGKIAGGSSFIITERGGLPLSPYESLESRAVMINWVELPEDTRSGRVESLKSRRTTPSTPQPPTEMVEAQGWIVNSKGKVVLVAQLPVRTSAVNPRSQLPPPSCH